MIGRKFGSFNLQDPTNGIWVTGSDIYSSVTNNIQADSLAETDGARVVKQQRSSKTWTEQGVLRSNSRAGLEGLIDSFKLALAKKNQAFDLDYASGTRRYLANVRNLAIADNHGLNTVIWNAEFFCADGVGWNLATEELLASSAFTANSASWTTATIGSYMVEPNISITYGTITGGTAKSVSINNGETLRGLTIARTWVSGDVIEVDSLNKRVYVNNQPADFTGQFPVWEPGTAVISYLDDMTTRSATILVSYTPRWL